MNTFQQFREMFPDFWAYTLSLHRNPPHASVCHPGHTEIHDASVIALCGKIAPDNRTALKAQVAAALHTFDHLEKKELVKALMEKALLLVPKGFFTQKELDEILTAALRHKELNKDDGSQSLTQQVLMDADRLANLMLVTYLNLARCPTNRPTLELEHLRKNNPATTYRDPKSVLDEARTHYAYLPMFRMEKAKLLASEYAAEFERLEIALVYQFKELMLDDVKL
jgi:hypothetical protein